MGKRKRRADPNKAGTSDILQHPSQTDAMSQQLQESSPQVENNAVTPISSILELVDDAVKLPNSSQPVHQHRSSRAMFLKNSSMYTRKYSRRNTGGGHVDASPSHSHVKVIPLHDEKVIFKMANRSHLEDSEPHTGSLATAIQKPERIRLTPLSTDAPPHDMGKMCRICEKLLRKKPIHSGISGISPSEPSVVAVLVCGHTYHADCLEQKTCQEERMDPSCPLCRSLTSERYAQTEHK